MMSRTLLLPVSLLLFLTLLTGGCAPSSRDVGRDNGRDNGEGGALMQLRESRFVASDGHALPLRQWSPDGPPRAVLVALHGFNDYSKAFEQAADYWAREHGIHTYAYDQRGFGANPEPGTWAGTERYAQDLREFTGALRQRHPDTPVHVLGSSMGGAIAMVAFASPEPPEADGVILAAPAVWGRETMPWYQRAALYVAARTIPWASFSGQGLDVTASDNREMLVALGQDPKVIKSTRVAAMYGLTNLMDAALESAGALPGPSLILIGERDEVIPPAASATMLERLSDREQVRVAAYEEGYHMLLRDLQRQVVWDDVAAWIRSRDVPLPSGATVDRPGNWSRDVLVAQ